MLFKVHLIYLMYEQQRLLIAIIRRQCYKDPSIRLIKYKYNCAENNIPSQRDSLLIMD